MYKRIYDSEEIVVDYYNDGKPMIRVSQFKDYHWQDEHFVELPEELSQNKSGDLVSRGGLEKALSELGRMYIDGIADDKAYLSEQRVYEVLRNAPAVEAEPVVHAHWVDRPDGAYRICTNCNCGVPTMPKPPAWFRCPVCGAHMDEKRLVPMYLGNCEETDCEHWRWCGDSYHDRNTECYCLLNGKSVYRHEAEEKMILCPMGKMMEDEGVYD